MKKVILILCVMAAITLQAQTLKKATDAQAKAMVEKINQTASSIRILECDFTQVKTLRFLNDKMTSQGKMYYDGSGKLRWEYTSPYQYTFILNGQKVYIKSAKSSQTIDIRQSKLFQSIAQVMMNSVTGKSLTTNSDFACTMYTQEQEWVADLVPKKKEMKKMFKNIRLHFNSVKQMVSQVEMTEQSGDTTMITLKDVKTNGKIDEKMFAAH
jgi:outer membrane lipoprotein carrier protein